MHKYTAALASRLGYPGLTARAQFVFDQAMEKGRCRWGRRARLVSGAAMLIILREAQKGETVNDISVRQSLVTCSLFARIRRITETDFLYLYCIENPFTNSIS